MDEFSMIFGGGMDDDGDMERMVDLHPLNVFAKLSQENPESKLYRQCLQNEIDMAAEALDEKMDERQFLVLEHIVNHVPEERLRNSDGGEELTMRLDVLKRIFSEVRKRKAKRSPEW